MTVQERIENRINKDPSGCWLWTGSTNEHGYGKIKIKGKSKRVHRVYFEIINGGIPENKCILHTCDTPPCINPKHLFVGSMSDNSQDMVKKDRHNNQNKNKNLCIRGHIFSKENTLYSISSVNGRIGRTCRTCKRGRQRKNRAKRKANE